MTFAGDLKNISLGDVFQNIQGNRATGTLQLQVRGNKRFVYFHEGMVAGYSLGLRRGLPVRDTFVQRQWISAGDFERAQKRKQKSSQPLAEVCEALKIMSSADFRACLAEVMQEQLYELLAIKEATFEFLEGKPVPRAFDAEQQKASLRIDPSAVLMEGARRADEMSRIEQVVSSEQDLFVMVEGSEDVELDSLQDAVAVCLDGHTEVRALLETLPYGRFDILKAIHDLVKDDLCRPLSGREIESQVDSALAAGDEEEAISLLQRSLLVERSNHDHRLRLAELLERVGRPEESAAELAVLGHQAAVRGAVDEAVDLYAQAVALHPSEIGLHERRVALLAEHDPEDHQLALFEYSDQLLAAGLAEKARALLAEALKGAAPDYRQELQRRRAEIEDQLGHPEGAAGIYREIADGLAKDDDEGRLSWLQKAQALCPEDEELRAEVDLLASGQARRNRSRRRRRGLLAAAAVTMVAIATMGVVEMRASHSVIQSLDKGIVELSRGDAVTAMGSLQEVQDRYTWTLAGHRAGKLRARLFHLSLERFEVQLGRGEIAAAREGLTRLQQQGTQQDERQRLDALLARVAAEERALELFGKINSAQPDEDAASEFASAPDPELMDFYLRQLDRSEGLRPRAARLLLTVLRQLDNPRCFAPVARCYLRAADPAVLAAAATILETAPRHRQAGRAATWEEFLPELRAASSDAELAPRLRALLGWLAAPE